MRHCLVNHSESGKLGYEKSRDFLLAFHKARSQSSRQSYEKNPKLCPVCNIKLPYKKRRNVCCSHSCATRLSRPRLNTGQGHQRLCPMCGKKCWGERCMACRLPQNSYEPKSGHSLRYYLFRTRQYKCEMCGLTEWNGKPIMLEVDHVDGNSGNNSEENLRLLCPNCHSCTPSFKGRNRGNGREERRKRYHEQRLHEKEVQNLTSHTKGD